MMLPVPTNFKALFWCLVIGLNVVLWNGSNRLFSHAQSLSYSPAMTAGTHSRAQAEYETLVELDRQINELQKRQEIKETLGGLIALAQLYHLRDEHWKQGGNWAALRYTDRALRKVPHRNKTTDDELGENLGEEEFIADEEVPYALVYALQVHKATIFLSLGEFDRSIHTLDQIFRDLFSSSSSQASTISSSSSSDLSIPFSSATTQSAKHFAKQISVLFLLKGDAYLGQGKQSLAITMYRKSILSNPCQHKAFYKLAMALTSILTKSSVSVERLSNMDPEYPLLIEDVMKRCQFAVSHITLQAKEIVLRNGTKPICTFFEDESSSTSTNSAFASSSDSFEILQSYSELREMTESLAVSFAINSLSNRLRIIQSTFQWALFLLNDALATAATTLTSSNVVAKGSGTPITVNGTQYQHALFSLLQIAPHLNSNLKSNTVKRYLTSAWNALQQARYLDRFRLAESTTYRLEDGLQAAEHIQTFFKEDYWPKQSKDFLGSTSRTPVFIVGFFRSGSTLLESLLDSHPVVWGMGEDSVFTYEMHDMEKDMMNIATRKAGDGNQEGMDQEQSTEEKRKKAKDKGNKRDSKDKKASLDNQQLTDFHDAIRRHGNNIIRKMKQRYKDYHPSWYDEEFRQNYKPTTDKQSHQGKVSTGSKTSKDELKNKSKNTTKSGKDTEDSAMKLPSISRLVDKMLLNYRNIALIHLVFPNALILHITRDPLDTLFSCIHHRFGDSSSFTLEFRTLILEYIAYLEIMQHFRKVLPVISYSASSNSATGANGKKKIERQALIDIRYEELVAKPEKVLTNIFEMMEIDASEETVQRIIHSFYGGRAADNASANQEKAKNSESNSEVEIDVTHVARPVHTSSFLQVKQPIYQKSVGSWRRYADYLNQTVIPELAMHLKRLRKLRALPWDKKNSKTRVNWDLDRNFNYTSLLDNLAK